VQHAKLQARTAAAAAAAAVSRMPSSSSPTTLGKPAVWHDDPKRCSIHSQHGPVFCNPCVAVEALVGRASPGRGNYLVSGRTLGQTVKHYKEASLLLVKSN